MLKYKRVKADSQEALRLQQKGYKIINCDTFNNYVLFEIYINNNEKE